MKEEKNDKILYIVSLFMAILTLTVGFAAFSNTLTISSNAMVVPNASDFKMKVYGVPNWNGSYDYTNLNLYSSDVVSAPMSTDKVLSATNAQIINGGMSSSISGISAVMNEPGNTVIYYFVIKNEGEYDAYLDTTSLDGYITGLNGTCVAGADAREDLVQQTCQQIKMRTLVETPDEDTITTGDDYKIAKGDYIVLSFLIEYNKSVDVRADGDFTVNFPTINLEFSSVPPGE